jgi:hypothetical protein
MDDPTSPGVLTPSEQAEQRLDALMSRIHEPEDLVGKVKRQIADHPLWFSGVVLGLVGLVGGLAAVLAHRSRQQPLAQLARAGGGVMEALRTLDHVASTLDRMVKREPSAVGQISTAAGSTVAALVARRLAERLIQRI